MILDSLRVMLFGMAGIFIVMALIAGAIFILDKLGASLKKDNK